MNRRGRPPRKSATLRLPLRLSPRLRQPVRFTRFTGLPASVRRLGRIREHDNPIRKNLPNAITMSNLACGVLAIMVASSTPPAVLGEAYTVAPRIYLSCLLVVLAAILDRYDGKLARLLGAESDFGKQLDSLCDLISFGIAPAVISWQLHAAMLSGHWRIVGYVIAVAFPLAGAFRLARFNLSEDHSVFQGVPITLAGSLLILYSLIEAYLLFRGRLGTGWVVATGILAVLLSGLMASRLRIRKR